jgi:hypothetical protein
LADDEQVSSFNDKLNGLYDKRTELTAGQKNNQAAIAAAEKKKKEEETKAR